MAHDRPAGTKGNGFWEDGLWGHMVSLWGQSTNSWFLMLSTPCREGRRWDPITLFFQCEDRKILHSLENSWFFGDKFVIQYVRKIRYRNRQTKLSSNSRSFPAVGISTKPASAMGRRSKPLGRHRHHSFRRRTRLLHRLTCGKNFNRWGGKVVGYLQKAGNKSVSK